jgi:hypothetical protein
MDAKTSGCILAFEKVIIVARQFLFVKVQQIWPPL